MNGLRKVKMGTPEHLILASLCQDDPLDPSVKYVFSDGQYYRLDEAALEEIMDELLPALCSSDSSASS